MKKVMGLDGKNYDFRLHGYSKQLDDKSSLHLKARQILKELYPFTSILEEVLLPGTKQLRVDFYVPSHALMVEVNGEQHYEYNKFFHGKDNEFNFTLSKRRDLKKEEWCEINNIRLVILSYDNCDSWREQIKKS